MVYVGPLVVALLMPVYLWATWTDPSTEHTMVQSMNMSTLSLSTPQDLNLMSFNEIATSIESSPDGTVVAVGSQTVGLSGRFGYGGVTFFTAVAGVLTSTVARLLGPSTPFEYPAQASQPTFSVGGYSANGWNLANPLASLMAGYFNSTSYTGALVWNGGANNNRVGSSGKGIGAACINGSKIGYLSTVSGNLYQVDMEAVEASGSGLTLVSAGVFSAGYLALASGGDTIWYNDTVFRYVRSVIHLSSTPALGPYWPVSGLTGGLALDPDGEHAWVIDTAGVERLNLSTGALDSTTTFAYTPVDLGLPQP